VESEKWLIAIFWRLLYRVLQRISVKIELWLGLQGIRSALQKSIMYQTKLGL